MFVAVDGQRLFFDAVGAKLALDGPVMREKPTLVVLHGGPGFDHSGMREDFDGFADVAQVLYLDQRGNGRSRPSDPKTWNLAQWGDDVRALCDALGIEKPIVLGQSFGGMVAQAYVTRHPEHPKAVILSSTVPRLDLPASFKIFEAKGGAEARAIAERFWQTGADADWADYARVVAPLYNTTTRPGGEDRGKRAIATFDVYRHFAQPGREMHTMDFRAALARVTCPVLVLAGAEDPIAPPHRARELAEAIDPRRVTLEILDRCGHGAFRDDPPRALGLIRRFVEHVVATT